VESCGRCGKGIRSTNLVWATLADKDRIDNVFPLHERCFEAGGDDRYKRVDAPEEE
jgi:hypothetical protein